MRRLPDRIRGTAAVPFAWLLMLSQLSLSCASVPAPPRSLVTKPSPLMMLGTFHFESSSDLNFEKPDGVLSERRQRELEEIASRMAAFRPTRVCLEFVPEHEAEINERYRRYLKGEYELGENEVYQIGFRVAKMSGLNEVHLVDHRLGLPLGRIKERAGRLGQAHPYEQLEQESRERSRRRLDRDTADWRQVFLEMNAPENIRGDHSYYIDLLPLIGADGEYDGADVAALWYRRNLRIYTNVARLNREGDRLFLLIGAGHLGALREMFGSSSRFELVDARDYLKD